MNEVHIEETVEVIEFINDILNIMDNDPVTGVLYTFTITTTTTVFWAIIILTLLVVYHFLETTGILPTFESRMILHLETLRFIGFLEKGFKDPKSIIFSNSLDKKAMEYHKFALKVQSNNLDLFY